MPWIETGPTRADGRSRPAWTKSANPGHKTTYLHLFAKQVRRDLAAAEDLSCPDVASLASEAQRRFSLLPASDQAAWKAKAAAKRVLAASRPAPIDLLEFPDQAGLCPDGPLGLSSRDSLFPMRPGVVEEKLAAQSFADRVKAWERQHSSRASPDPGFPDSVPGKSVCLGWCLGSIDADRALAVSELVTYLRRVLRFFGAQTKGDGRDPTTVLKLRSATHTFHFLVAHTQQQTTSLFEAELMRLEPALSHLGDENSLPILLGLCPGKVICGARWPEIQDEHQVAATLIELALDWEVSLMTSRPALPGQRYVTAATVISVSDTEEKERAHLQAAKAMQAFKKLTQPGAAKKPPRASHKRKAAAAVVASGRGGAAAASSSDFVPAASGQPEADDPASSDTPSTAPSSDEDLRDCWHTILKSIKSKDRKVLPRPGKPADTAVSEELLIDGAAKAPIPAIAAPPLVRDNLAPAPIPAIAAPPLVRGPRVAQAKRGSRIVEERGVQRGLATISEVWASGPVIGYGMICGRHRNAADKPSTQCKKQVHLGDGPTAMSHHEAKQRLKRWFISAQFQEGDWDVARMRSEHLKLGGKHLSDLASDVVGWSDMSDDELNEACQIVPPPI